jgi:ABC-type uncharacterized transport system substrate-binding protein
MRRIGLAVVLAVALVPLAAEAQQAGKVYRIGFLLNGSPPPPTTPLMDAFRDRLRELGWVEGQNLAIEFRGAGGNFDRLPDLAADIVGRKVDVIVTAAPPAAQAAKQATSVIPIVFTGAGDAVAQGLVASLARPGGNVTGAMSGMQVDLIGKRLELLKAAIPGLARIAVLRCPVVDGPPNLLDGRSWSEIQAAAGNLGVTLQSLEVGKPDDIEGVFDAARKARAQAYVLLGCRIFETNVQRVADVAAQRRLPGMHYWTSFVVAGGLMSYDVSLVDIWRRAAVLVDKILKGAKPADLPVEQPTKFELVINLKTAKALGLTIPPSVLGRADQLIE